MLRTFEYKMDMGAVAQTTFARNKVQFGDGYAQYYSTGLNNKRTDWSGTKTGNLETVIKPIMKFIDDHEGIRPFLWTDPHGKTNYYTCAGYSTPQRIGTSWQISLDFEQFISL